MNTHNNVNNDINNDVILNRMRREFLFINQLIVVLVIAIMTMLTALVLNIYDVISLLMCVTLPLGASMYAILHIIMVMLLKYSSGVRNQFIKKGLKIERLADIFEVEKMCEEKAVMDKAKALFAVNASLATMVSGLVRSGLIQNGLEVSTSICSASLFYISIWIIAFVSEYLLFKNNLEYRCRIIYRVVD